MVASQSNKRSSLSAGIYFDNDFAAFVGARAGEHFVRSNNVGQRNNATHGSISDRNHVYDQCHFSHDKHAHAPQQLISVN